MHLVVFKIYYRNILPLILSIIVFCFVPLIFYRLTLFPLFAQCHFKPEKRIALYQLMAFCMRNFVPFAGTGSTVLRIISS